MRKPQIRHLKQRNRDWPKAVDELGSETLTHNRVFTTNVPAAVVCGTPLATPPPSVERPV